jgi:protein-tyrosine-phosphatase
MADRGIDIAGRQTKPLTGFTHSRFDRVITLCDKVREVCPEFPNTPLMAHWSIPDPAATGGSKRSTYHGFEQVADDIERRVQLLLADLENRPTERTQHV